MALGTESNKKVLTQPELAGPLTPVIYCRDNEPGGEGKRLEPSAATQIYVPTLGSLGQWDHTGDACFF